MLGKVLASVAIAAVSSYVLVLALMYFFQEKLIFPGGRLPENYQFRFDFPFRELTIEVDGAELNALHFHQPESRGVVFFLHGNGGNLVDWTENADWYRRNNYDLFIFDYRGYGKSTGRIASQKQLMDDVRTAWDVMKMATADKPVVIYGRSLGTALAAELATEVNADLLILVSPFTSMLAMVEEHYPFAPKFLLRYPMQTEAVIDRVNQDAVLVHGDRDLVIPIEHSRRLLSLARPSTRFLPIAGAGHNDIHQFPAYLDGLASLLPGAGLQRQ